MNAQPMTVLVRDSGSWGGKSVEGLRCQMAPAKAEEPAKIVFLDTDETTTTGSRTPPVSEDSFSRAITESSPPSRAVTGSEDSFSRAVTESTSFSRAVTENNSFSRAVTESSSLSRAVTETQSVDFNTVAWRLAEAKAELTKQRADQLVVIRNISHVYDEQMFMEELRDGGFLQPRDFDDCYMPLDNNTGMHLGCCVINFLDFAVRNEFFAAFQDRALRLAPLTAQRLCVQSTSRKELKGLSEKLKQAARAQPESQQQQSGPACHLKTARRAQFCPFCGSHVAPDFNFCSSCGSSLGSLR